MSMEDTIMNELYHYGVSKLDGSPGRGSGRYPLGSGKRPRSQNNKTVFISGSSKTQSKDSGYYRPLPKEIRNKIDGYIENGHKIIVGDAPGVDRQVQNYLNKKGYDNVEIYGPGKEVRYTANKKWKTNPIDAPEFEPNSDEWRAKKDIAMSEAADIGLAIVLDEGAKATRNNVQRLRDANKEVEVYELSKNGKANDKWIEDEIMSNTYLKHYGVSKMDGAPGRGSGRYPLGSGEEPRAEQRKRLRKEYKKSVKDIVKKNDGWKGVISRSAVLNGAAAIGTMLGNPVAGFAAGAVLAGIYSVAGLSESFKTSSELYGWYQDKYGIDAIDSKPKKKYNYNIENIKDYIY